MTIFKSFFTSCGVMFCILRPVILINVNGYEGEKHTLVQDTCKELSQCLIVWYIMRT